MRKALAGLLLVAACGAPAREPAEVTIGGPPSAPPPPTAARVVVPVDATLPKDAAAIATVDMASVQRQLASIFQNGDVDNERSARERGVRELEKTLGVAKGSLAPDRAFDTLGLDASRSASIALVPLSAAGHEKIAPLEALAQKALSNPSVGAAIVADVRSALAGEKAMLRLRAIVPAKDGAAAKRALRHLLTDEKLKDVAPPPGVDLLMYDTRLVVALSADETWMVLDIVASRNEKEQSAQEVVAMITELRAHKESGGSGLDLAGAQFRARFVPRKVAEIGFLQGVVTTSSAMAGVDASQQARITMAGLGEAHRALELAGNERGDYFSAVEIVDSASGPNGKPLVTATATFGPGFADAAKAAAKVPRGIGFDGAGLYSLLDGSLATGLAFRLPGDTASTLATEAELAIKTREAGWSGELVAGPLIPILFMSTSARSTEAFSPKSAALRLERVGFVETSRTDGHTFVGLLRAGTSDAEATCVLAGSAPCARHALKPNAPPVQVGEKWARVAKVGDRFVVLIGVNAGAVANYKPALGPAGAAPIRVKLPIDVLRSLAVAFVLGNQPLSTLVGSGEVSETALTLRVETAP